MHKYNKNTEKEFMKYRTYYSMKFSREIPSFWAVWQLCENAYFCIIVHERVDFVVEIPFCDYSTDDCLYVFYSVTAKDGAGC